MLSKDRIIRALQAKESVRSDQPYVPAALLSGGTWAFRQKRLTLREVLEKPEEGVNAIIEVNRLVKSDIVWPGSGYHNLLIHILGGKIKFRPQGNIDVQEPLINRVSEADRLDLGQIDCHDWIKAIRFLISEVDSQIGSNVLVGTSSWGPFTLAGQFFGVEKLMRGLYQDKKAIHALMAAMTELCIRYLEPAINKGALILSIAEPTASGDLISLRHFEEFALPYIHQVAQRLKEQGGYTTLHICGNIKDCLSLIEYLPIDLLSLDYKVDLDLAQRAIGGKMAIAGNVNPVWLKEKTPDEVILAAKECIRQAGRAANYILMPGCDIPPGVPLENVQAFLSAGQDSEA